jgi:hypothetical protein
MAKQHLPDEKAKRYTGRGRKSNTDPAQWKTLLLAKLDNVRIGVGDTET